MNQQEFSRKYFDLLTTDYAGINLTRITNYDEFVLKQIDDSLAPLYQSDVFVSDLNMTGTLVDIGFGGGFPILPMAHTLKDKKFIGIETRNKKVTVVTEIGKQLGLNNFKLLHSRIENIVFDVPVTCTLKAVGKVNDFLSKINSTNEISVFFYKGPGFYELEKDQLEIAKKNWTIIEEKELNVEGTEKRLLIGFKSKNVPCGTTKVTNELVKLSTLL
jgi:16S rRNA (guanine527-N7)-methyltransferase